MLRSAGPLFEDPDHLPASDPTASSLPTVQLDPSGRIVDFIDPAKTRPDSPEERVRQHYARVLVEEYGYPRDQIALEAPINIGSELRLADIAVYDSVAARARREQGRILLVVETKAPNVDAGRGQLTSYLFASSAEGGVWTNGEEAAYFHKLLKPQRHLREWTNIPRFGETWDVVGNYRKEDLKPPRNLKQVFKRCHNALYREGLDSEDVAMDMVRIILAKYQDELSESDVCDFRCTPSEYETAEGCTAVAGRVRSLFAQVVNAYPDVFDEGEHITIDNDRSLATVVNELQPFRFVAQEEEEQVYDVIGTAFEVYMATHLKGNRGQYFTNRLVVGMIVRILNPDENDLILDPACGPGGFLIACLRHVRRKIMQSNRTAFGKHTAVQRASQRLFGIDISRRLVSVAKTNMILNGDGHGGIVRGNSLHSLVNLPREFLLRPEAARYPHRPTKIFTNPPFGAGQDLLIKNLDILDRFELGHETEEGQGGWLRRRDEALGRGVPPEILFLERCIEWLAPGGRMAIVIARGVLDNRYAEAARQYVLRKTRLLGVVNCHPNTFAPFNGTKASVLFLEKKEHEGIELEEDYPVFMAISQRVGQDSLGREIYRRDNDGNLVINEKGHLVIDHDLDSIVEAWHQFEQGQKIRYEAAWSIPVSRILRSYGRRLNPTRYAPEAERALASVLELAGSDKWEVSRLGDIATVFNGPRFKRPYADEGVTTGPGIVPYYTPKALFERRGESMKHLDLSKASPTQLRQLEVLTLQQGWIVVVDSGTAGKLMGRVGMTTREHDGTVGSNNLIRIIINDPERRAYVYQFLRSDLGQMLLLRNVYGTNQDHIEPDDVKDIPVPFPSDKSTFETLANKVQGVIEMRERAAQLDTEASEQMDYFLSEALGVVTEGESAADSGTVTEQALPYPETDFSPALQRTLKRKLESGETDEVDREEFFKALGRTVKSRDESSDE